MAKITSAEFSHALKTLSQLCLQGDTEACKAFERLVFIGSIGAFWGPIEVPIPLGDPPIDRVLPPNESPKRAAIEAFLDEALRACDMLGLDTPEVDREIAAVKDSLARA
jgi:hypothetical protein